MGSASSVSAQDNNLPGETSARSGHLLSSLGLLESRGDPLGSRLSSDHFAPSRASTEVGDGTKKTFQLGQNLTKSDLNLQSSALSVLSECPLLTASQESKIRTCLTSLEELMSDSQLRFETENILSHATIEHEEGGEEVQLLDRVGDGLFVVDMGTVFLLSPGSNGEQVIQLSEGDYCGEYSTLFNVPFRIEVQFKSSVSLLHLPADIVRLNMHSAGQLDREAMLNLSISQSNLLSSSLFGEDISNRVVVNCLKASLFSGLGEESLNYLATTATPLLFSGGEVVYNEGERPTFIFLVLKGIVQLLKGGRLHRAHKVKLSTEGVSIAANEFFAGGLLTHQAVAGGPLLLAPIGREQILDMLNKFPESADAVKSLVQKR